MLYCLQSSLCYIACRVFGVLHCLHSIRCAILLAEYSVVYIACRVQCAILLVEYSLLFGTGAGVTTVLLLLSLAAIQRSVPSLVLSYISLTCAIVPVRLD